MACFTVVVGQLVHLVVAALVVTVCGQQEHFVVVGQRAHFVVALVELWQHVHFVVWQLEHFVVVGQLAHFVVALVELWQHVHCA
ncbi:MAG: hypothetical protein ACXV4C_09140, partial [Halobacteriota archaeon]